MQNIIFKTTFKTTLILAVISLMAIAPAFADMGNQSAESGSGMANLEKTGYAQKSAQTRMDFSKVFTGNMNSGGVRMDMKPVSFKDGKLKVKFSANTHTGSLGDYDLMELSTLEFGDKSFRPVKADRMRGHHAGGMLVFEVSELPEHFNIIVEGIRNRGRRVFEY